MVGITQDATLLITIKARDEAEAALARTKGALGGFGPLGALAGAAIATIGVAAIAAGGLAIKMASDFEDSMTLLRTQAGASAKEVDYLRDRVIALGPAVGFGPKDLADALFHIESVGFRGAAAMDVLRVGAEGAKVGHANLEDTVKALDSAMMNHLKDVHSSTDAMGLLNSTVGAGDMRMGDLAASMGTGILSSAKMFGLGLQDVGGALAEMTSLGSPAEESATRLRMTFALLGAPSSKAAGLLKDLGMSAQESGTRMNAVQEALKKSGVSMTTLSEDMRQGGLIKAFQDLKDHMNAAGVSADEQAAIITKAFGGGKSGGTIIQMYQNIDLLREKTKAVGDGAHTFADAWAVTQQQFSFRWDQMRASVDAILIQWGNKLLPYASMLVGYLGDKLPAAAKTFSTWFDVHGPQITGFFQHDLVPWVERATNLFKFFADHIQLVELAVGLLLARFIAIKTLGMIEWVGGMTQAFVLMAEKAGGLQAVMAVLGMGGSGGISGAARGAAGSVNALRGAMGGTSTATTLLRTDLGEVAAASAGTEAAMVGVGAETGAVSAGMLGLATGGLAIAAVAIVALVTNAGGLRSSLKDLVFGMGNTDDGAKQLAKGLQDTGKFWAEWTGAAAPDLDMLQKKMNDSMGFTERLNGNLEMSASNLRRSWDSTNTAGHAVISQLLEHDQRESLELFEQTLRQYGGDASLALNKLADTNGGVFLKMRDNQVKRAQEAADGAVTANRQATTSALGLAQSFADNANSIATMQGKNMGLQGKALDNYIKTTVAEMTRQFNALHPEIVKANALIHAQAVELHLTDDQVKAMTQDAIEGALAVQRATQAAADAAANAIANAARAWGHYADAANTAARAAGAGWSAPGGGVRVSAEGNKFSSPTLTWAGEGGETEWIIPQHKARGFEGLLDSLLAGGSAAMPGGSGGASLTVQSGSSGGGSEELHIHLNVDGREMTRTVLKHQGQMGRLQGIPLGSNS